MTPWEEFKKKSLEERTKKVTPLTVLNRQAYLDDEVLSEKRYEICEVCPRFFKITKQCKECGCFMAIKTKLREAVCPLGKW
jgi:hypothetical protein